MNVYLLDINFLVALLWANHEQHNSAREWFRAHKRFDWASCPITQAGFVRVSSNPGVFPEAPSPAKAIEVLKTNLSHPRHRFWKDDLSLAESVAPFAGSLKGHLQVTDAYLLGLAIRKGGILATFDAGISALLPERSPHLNALEILDT